VTARSEAQGVPTSSEYRAFCSWEPMSAQAEADLFAEFWAWFRAMRAATDAAGLRFRAYCYNAAAENSQFRRIAAKLGLADEIAAFTGSDQWVDMYRVFNRQMITGRASGLKQVAPLAGFAWEVSNPGGDESIVRYDAAVAGDDQARDWLIAYNRNDTQATFALREWLDHSASDCPPIEDARYGAMRST
jgi:predicted RecB family nuclease